MPGRCPCRARARCSHQPSREPVRPQDAWLYPRPPGHSSIHPAYSWRAQSGHAAFSQVMTAVKPPRTARWTLTDGHEVSQDVVNQPPVEAGINRVFGRTHEQGVPVGRRLGGNFGTKIGARPGAILDDQLPLDLRGQLLRLETRHDIHATTRPRRCAQAQRPRLIGLRRRRGAHQNEAGRNEGNKRDVSHSHPLVAWKQLLA